MRAAYRLVGRIPAAEIPVNMTLNELKNALENYFEAIALQKSADESTRPPLRPHFEKLDQLAAQLPPHADPQLRHYMKQKSYEKALNFLSGRGDENLDGSCTR
jgi:hypothetical protein